MSICTSPERRSGTNSDRYGFRIYCGIQTGYSPVCQIQGSTLHLDASFYPLACSLRSWDGRKFWTYSWLWFCSGWDDLLWLPYFHVSGDDCCYHSLCESVRGFSVLFDKNWGILREIMASPMPRRDLIIGISLSSVTKSLIQTVIIIVFGIVLGVTFFSGELWWSAHLTRRHGPLCCCLFSSGALCLTLCCIQNIIIERVPGRHDCSLNAGLLCV